MLKNQKFTSDSDRKHAQIFGVGLNGTAEERVLRFVREELAQGRKFFITTPNPEIVLLAKNDRNFQAILNSSSLSLPDGIGLIAAHKFLSLPKVKDKALKIICYFFQGLWSGFALIFKPKWLFLDLAVVKGRVVFLKLCTLANKKGWKVFFLGGDKNQAQKTAENLRKNYKSIKIDYAPGPKLDKNGSSVSQVDREIEKDVIDKINSFSPQILFVGFGAPKQEFWLHKWLTKLNIGGAMVVGGTFNSYSNGVVPPKWMEEGGIEWLWRLIKQPWRIKRIWNAVVVFPWEIYLLKIRNQK